MMRLSFLEGELDANENEYLDMHSSSEQKGLINTFSLPNRQPTTVPMSHTLSRMAEESKRIKEPYKNWTILV